MKSDRTILTIGHSNLEIEEFIEVLKSHGVTAIADVRSHPYSRYLPHFNRSSLEAALKQSQIRYVFLGRELGARPQDLSCYVRGKALYDRIANTELFQQGIDRLLTGIKKYRVCLMCSEKDPITCHRTILVCQNLKYLKQEKISVEHILESGIIESHDELEERLLHLQKLHPLELDSRPQQLSLFATPEAEVATLPRNRESCLQQAYRQQGDKIAYVEKPRPQPDFPE
ncbi:MAG: DUF488 domain-containing protein [Cyanobacteriota bacterium]|nr:DUF488 domain-containing protein [Cyanobacteriota bacterium]